MNQLTKISAMTGNQKTSHEGGVAYETSFRETLAEFFSLGLLNGTFYQSQEEVLKGAKTLFEYALEKDPEFATKCAVYGNEVNSLKLVPTVWLVYLSTLEDKSLFQKAFPRIIKNPKMLFDFVEIARHGGIRNGVGHGVKRVINQWLINHLNEYQVSRNKGKLLDVIRVTRPKYQQDDFQSYMKYLSKDELSFARVIALKEVIDQLRQGVVNEQVLSLVRTYRIQLEELKHSVGELSNEGKRSLYGELYGSLNYAALILNLVALERVFAIKTQREYRMGRFNENGFRRSFHTDTVVETDIPESIIQLVVSKIENVEAYKKSNMLPFALVNAQNMVVTPEFKVALGNVLQKIAGETFSIDPALSIMVNVDTSGSMGAMLTESLRVVDIATLFGALMKKSHANTNVFAVATSIREVKLNKQDNLFTMKQRIEDTEVGSGTYFAQIMNRYQGERFVILLTDSVAADDLEVHWRSVTKDSGAKLIVWQLEAYRTKLSNDPNVIYLAGYSDRLLSLVKNMIEGKATQLEEIDRISL